MKLVLLSGGSGKRLWPLSNDSRSKQFLKILEGDNGKNISMFQRVWKQLNNVNLADSTVIATSKSQVDMIQGQLENQVGLIIEPSRRDTFPAIALAATYLYSVKHSKTDDVVAVLPVDPFVHDSFFERVKDLEAVINESNSDLALIGVQPTYPSSKYGYIVPSKKESESEFLKVNGFYEKPTEETASNLIGQGALWNCGLFAFKLSYILDILKEKGFPTSYDELLVQYDKLPKISFDYEVVEKTKDIVVLPYDGYWKDLGTWNTLTEEMAISQIGKGVISNDSENTHLINELDIPVTILGATNLVVAASPDGILVSDKDASPRIKELVGDFDNRPMYEERRWGWYRVLDYTKYEEGNEVLTKRIGIHAGSNLSYQCHNKRREVWTIMKGEGVLAFNGDLSVVRAGDVIQINAGDHHALKAYTEIELIEVQSGSELIEEDINRVFMTWTEIEEFCYSFVN
ncbi:sugar phosphate nucleotidyltransferase [Peribacillus frigoritolerans]|uniref:sugar phosphate nucleotidyltransferase n=1 Tax=Peribacillus frigoritolerans TaxID=450367 RepID=UPI002E1D7D56|nr:sugar phosphate nucleotidyltransferase [Peribacillus frigoritolerans]MED3835000.1 sugar phosphate nucleotidyltransferase [Peribacillus frigoritolerans]MED3844535.1 sugar phosphate nucleotidyltransferase [Peribacillus frigoritolerans]